MTRVSQITRASEAPLETELRHLVAAAVSGKERAAAAMAIGDTLAVALAGAADWRGAVLLQTFSGINAAAPGLSKAFGSSLWLSPTDAALHFGFCAHLLDYDDDETELAMAHLSAPCLAAAYALMAEEGPSNRSNALADAYIAGCKGMLLLGAIWNPALHRAGWHPTSVLGIFGATIVSARLLDLTEEQSVAALRLAASLASGGRGAFGGMGKPLQVGQAAAAGVRCATLARAGWTGASSALCGPTGFASMLLGNSDDASPLPPVPSFPPEGFVTKHYPSCTATHAAVQAVLDLRCQSTTRYATRILCELDPRAIAILLDRLPRTADEARFSLPYCLSVALTQGNLQLVAFDESAFVGGEPADPTIRDLMERVEVQAAHNLPSGPSGIATGAHVHIDWDDRTQSRRTLIAAPGSVSLPTSEAALRSKWLDCLSRFTTQEGAAALLPLMQSRDLPRLFAALNDVVPTQGSET